MPAGTLKGRAIAVRTNLGASGFFQLSLAYDPPTNVTTQFTGQTAYISQVQGQNIWGNSWMATSTPNKDRVFVMNLSTSSRYFSWFDHVSGGFSGATFSMDDVRSVFATSDTGLIVINSDSLNEQQIWHSWNIGDSAPTAIYTGAYTLTRNNRHRKYFLFSSNKVYELLGESGQFRHTIYTLNGNTVTEDSTQLITTNLSATYFDNFTFSSSGYGVCREREGVNNSTLKKLWIYSGGTWTAMTTGFPAGVNDSRVDYPIAFKDGVIGTFFAYENAGTQSRFSLYSGGNWGTVVSALPNEPTGTSIIKSSYYNEDANSFLINIGSGVWVVSLNNNTYSQHISSGVNAEFNSSAALKIADSLGIYFSAGTSGLHKYSLLDWDKVKEGQLVRLTYHQFRTNTTTIENPTAVNWWVVDADSTGNVLASGSLSPLSGNPYRAGMDVWLTSNGTSGGTPVCGPIRLLVQASFNGAVDWEVNSENAAGYRGILRAATVPSALTVVDQTSTLRNPFAYPDETRFDFLTVGASRLVVADGSTRKFKLETLQSGGVIKTFTSATSTSSTTGIYKATGQVDDSYLAGNIATDVQVSVSGNSTALGEPWVHFLKPTGSEYEFIDPFTIKYSNKINIDKRLYTDSLGLTGRNGSFISYHPVSGTTGTTLFNREEVVSGYTYLSNARNEAIQIATATGTIVTASGNDGTFVLNHTTGGKYTGQYTIGASHEAAHDGIGTVKKLNLRPASSGSFTNAPTASGADSWWVTSWLKVDSHPQRESVLSRDSMTNNALNEDTDYIISSDLMYVWAHVQNARGEDVSGMKCQFTLIDPEDNKNDYGEKLTDADGWTESSGFVKVTPASPQGPTWKVQTVSVKSGYSLTASGGANATGAPNWGFSYETTTGGQFTATPSYSYVNFISAFRDNITMESSWGVQSVPGKWPVIGDSILVGFRPHKDGSGTAVDSGSIPKIKIGRFRQDNGVVEYYVGSESIGVNMTKVTDIYPTGDQFAWVYTWNTSGIPYGNYVYQMSAKIGGAISYEHGVMFIRSGYTLQTDFATHTGLTANVHGASGAVVGVSGAQTLYSKTISGLVLAGPADASGFRIVNLGDPLDSGDATNKRQLDLHAAASSGVHGVPTTSNVVGTNMTQTLSGKTLIQPTIADFVNAQHDHTSTTKGGQLDHGNLLNLTADHHTQYATNVELDAHEAKASGVHGIPTGSVFVGTNMVQTLSGKTLIQPTIADFTNAQHNHTSPAAGGDLDIPQQMSPLDFSLYGIFKTYLNPGNKVKSYTHNQIQGLADHTVNYQYDAGGRATGVTITNGTYTNIVGISYDASGLPTQIVETIQHILSGTAKTVTTVYTYSGSKVTSATTTVT